MSDRASASRWSDLRTRVLSAAVLAPLALGCIWAGGMAFAGMILLVSVALAYEWLNLCRGGIGPVSVAVFSVLPLAVLATARDAVPVAIAILAVGVVAALLLRRRIGGGWAAFGIAYLGLACVALQWLRAGAADGRAVVIVLLLIVWASDIGAYVVGRAVGGRKLAPTISPGKTVSGAIGGLAAAMAVGAGASILAGSAEPLAGALWAGLIAAVSQIGDLFESYVKRHFGVKDSSHLIPGHGGVLDRVDALIAAAPFAAILAFALGRGVVIW